MTKTSSVTWNAQKLAALTQDQRHTMWKRARTRTTEEARGLVELIEQAGLPYSEPGSLRMDDPLTRKMYDLINAPAGRKACIDATVKGLPAIAGVDGTLNEVLGVDYGSANMATNTAGVIVGELMRSLGYVHGGIRQMPKGSVAKTAAFWVPRAGSEQKGSKIRELAAPVAVEEPTVAKRGP